MTDQPAESAPANADSKPFAWVIPGQDNANDGGWLDCRINEEGEFTKPLYEHPPSSRIPAEKAPITHRWRARGAETWIYDPEPRWLEEHKFEVEWEPVYGAPQHSQSGTISETTCFIDRSEVRQIILKLLGSYDIVGPAVLARIDALPISVAADFRPQPGFDNRARLALTLARDALIGADVFHYGKGKFALEKVEEALLAITESERCDECPTPSHCERQKDCASGKVYRDTVKQVAAAREKRIASLVEENDELRSQLRSQLESIGLGELVDVISKLGGFNTVADVAISILATFNVTRKLANPSEGQS